MEFFKTSFKFFGNSSLNSLSCSRPKINNQNQELGSPRSVQVITILEFMASIPCTDSMKADNISNTRDSHKCKQARQSLWAHWAAAAAGDLSRSINSVFSFSKMWQLVYQV